MNAKMFREKVREKRAEEVNIELRDEQGNVVVDWDGEDDKSKPINWPALDKFINVGLVSVLTFSA